MARKKVRKSRMASLLAQNDLEEEVENDESGGEQKETAALPFTSTSRQETTDAFRRQWEERSRSSSSSSARKRPLQSSENLPQQTSSSTTTTAKRARKNTPSVAAIGNPRVNGLSLTQSLQREGMETTNDQGCVGAIEEIKLQDFMCHKNLHLKFEKGVNFLIGLNGSGKSSICSAIQIAFGGKSSSTGRSSNFRDVIREKSGGCAIVFVQLYNEGPFAFRPELFGNRIGIQRRLVIHTAGSVRNELRLYSKDGKLVKPDHENPKKLLEELKRDTSISVENPANIITQEKMKDFVNASHEQLYDLQFFMKACRLYQIFDHVRGSWQELQEAKERLEGEHSKEKLDELQSKYEEAKRCMKQIERVQRIDEHVKEAEVNVTWARYNKALGESIEADHRVQLSDQQLDRAGVNVEEREKVAKTLAEELKVKQAEYAEAECKIDSIQEEICFAARKKDDCGRIAHELKRSLEIRRTDLQLKRKDVERLESDIASLESNDQREELKCLREKLKKVTKDYEIKSQALRHKKAESAELRDRIDNSKEENSSAMAELKACKEKQAKNERYLAGISRSRTEQKSLAMYNDQVKNMYALIQENRHKFAVVPVGPCGMYLELKPEATDFRMAVETGIGRLLSSFLVHNYQDGRKFRELMARHSLRVDYTVLQKRPKTSSAVLAAKSPDQSYRHFLSLLKVDDDWVFNALCEAQNLHRVIICNDTDEAQRICRQGVREGMPQNCAKIYLMDGTQYSNYGGSEHFQPCYQLQSNFLNTSVDQKIKDVKEELTLLESSRKVTQSKVNDCEESLKEMRVIMKALKEDEAKLDKEMRELKEEEKKIKLKANKIGTELSSESEELSNKQEELIAAKRGLASVKQEVEDVQSQELKCEQDWKDAIARWQQLRDDVPDSSQLSALIKEMKSKEERYAEAYNRLRSARRNVTKYKEENDAVHEEFATMKKNVVDLLTEAQEKSGRDKAPDNSLSVEAAIRELQRVQKEKERLENDFQELNINAREIRENYDHTKQQYESALAIHQNLVELLKRLRGGRVIRAKQWNSHRNTKGDSLDSVFRGIMQKRRCFGKLDFEHGEDEKGRIIVNVAPDVPYREKETQQYLKTLQSQKSSHVESSQPAQQIRDLGTLSGGEKSYTTLALLGAFDTEIECPFRIMDEFDVYMDDTTRRSAVRTLLDIARDRKRQYIFLTPHDISGTLGKNETSNVIVMPSDREGIPQNGE